jgi:hypothetical protein
MATVADAIGRALKNRRSANDLPYNCAAAPRQERFKAGADRWPSLAVAPTFTIMTPLAGIHGGSTPDMLRPAVPVASPFGRNGADVCVDERLSS